VHRWRHMRWVYWGPRYYVGVPGNRLTRVIMKGAGATDASVGPTSQVVELPRRCCCHSSQFEVQKEGFELELAIKTKAGLLPELETLPAKSV
jgi:hypothetical protein